MVSNNTAVVLENLIPLVAIVGGLLIAAIAIISGTICSASRRRHFEESRREIAAYVAEGSMSPEDGQRLLETKNDSCKS